jgi:hypothetical protein
MLKQRPSPPALPRKPLSMATMKTFLVALAFVISFTGAAYAQAWRPTAQQCAAEINAKCEAGGGASCGGLWPQWAACALTRYYRGAIPPARIRACIASVNNDRMTRQLCNNCGDPVADVFRRCGGA